ncbi:cobalamin-dependent protein [soil metagenome]
MTGELVASYLDLARSGARREAIRMALQLLDDGVPRQRILEELVVVAQREVGLRWHRHEFSAVDEHLVTSVSQGAIEALSTSSPPRATRGLVAVACAEGDWHSLPSLLFSELLGGHGQGTIHLGASSPMEDVDEFLQRRRPDALVVSCSIALSFIGTARLVDAAHRHRLPALAGGRALTSTRAAALGADGWAPDAATAAQLLNTWRDRPPAIDPAPVNLNPDALTLDARAEHLAEQAFDDLARRFPPMADYDARQLQRTREDLAYIVRYLAAARLVDDPSVFIEFRCWLTDLLAARGVPAEALTAGIDSLALLVGPVDASAHQLATR